MLISSSDACDKRVSRFVNFLLLDCDTLRASGGKRDNLGESGTTPKPCSLLTMNSSIPDLLVVASQRGSS